VAGVLRRLGGWADLAELREHTGWHDIRRAVTGGRVIRAGRGRYMLPDLPAAERVAARARGVLSHTSAAQVHGLQTLLPPESAHVTVPHGARPPRDPQVTYHWRDLPPEDLAGNATGPVRTVLDCAAWLPFAEGLAVADSALQLDVVTAAELAKGVTGLGGHGVAGARKVVAVADGRAANPFESGLRAALIEGGVSGFRCQVEIRTPLLTARVDLADERRRIVAEADSYTHHGATRADFARDCLRYNELVRAGWIVLRFSWEEVMFHAERVAQTVLDVQRRVDATPVRQRRRKAAS
jgi:very-short-patch-repair endonuclease